MIIQAVNNTPRTTSRYPSWPYTKEQYQKRYGSIIQKQWIRWKHAPSTWQVVYDMTLEAYLKEPENPGYEWFARRYVADLPPSYIRATGFIAELYGVTAEELLDAGGDVLRTGKRIFMDVATGVYTSGGIWFVPIKADRQWVWVERNPIRIHHIDISIKKRSRELDNLGLSSVLIRNGMKSVASDDPYGFHYYSSRTGVDHAQFTIEGPINNRYPDPYEEPQYSCMGIEGWGESVNGTHEIRLALCQSDPLGQAVKKLKLIAPRLDLEIDGISIRAITGSKHLLFFCFPDPNDRFKCEWSLTTSFVPGDPTFGEDPIELLKAAMRKSRDLKKVCQGI